MRKFKFGKLVRDNVVQYIFDVGNISTYRTLSDEEYLIELKRKLNEDTMELAHTTPEEMVKELADIRELIDCILETLNIPIDQIIEIQDKKKQKWGSFNKKLFVEFVEAQDDSSYVNYYLSEPKRYQEIKD